MRCTICENPWSYCKCDPVTVEPPAAPEAPVSECNYSGDRCNSSRCPKHGSAAVPERHHALNPDQEDGHDPSAPAVPEAPALPEGNIILCGIEFELPHLRALLASQGLSIIVAKERAVLESTAKLSTDSLRAFGPPWSTSWSKFAEAELARRGSTWEMPHGIPEGENDKGWPEGTPDSVTKGMRNV